MSTPAQHKPSGVQALLSHPLVQQASQQANYRLAGLDKELSKYQFANDFESKTKLPKAVSFLGLAAFVSIALFLNVLGLAGPLSFLIGSVLPTYTSIQALESAGHEDDTQSLFYWVVFTALTAVEYIAIRPILYWVPFYYVFKSAFLLWLQLPGTRGAEVLYRQFVSPMLQKQAARKQYSAPTTAKLD